jgi:hypothetical protein
MSDVDDFEQRASRLREARDVVFYLDWLRRDICGLKDKTDERCLTVLRILKTYTARYRREVWPGLYNSVYGHRSDWSEARLTSDWRLSLRPFHVELCPEEECRAYRELHDPALALACRSQRATSESKLIALSSLFPFHSALAFLMSDEIMDEELGTKDRVVPFEARELLACL